MLAQTVTRNRNADQSDRLNDWILWRTLEGSNLWPLPSEGAGLMLNAFKLLSFLSVSFTHLH